MFTNGKISTTKNNSMKTILVLLSSYNGTAFIKDQLDSIRKQQGVKVDILVRDDGSHDGTVGLLEKYKLDYPDLCLSIIEGDNIGSTESFSTLLSYVNAQDLNYDFYSFADQDDIWIDDKLVSATEMLEGMPVDTPNLYFSDTTVVDASLELIDGIRRRKVVLSKGRALARNVATGCTMVFNRKAVDFYVNNKPDYIKIHDYAMFLLCSFLGNVVYDETSHILYRQHGNNQLGGMDKAKWRYAERIKTRGNINEHFLERVAYSFLKAYEQFLTLEDVKLISKMAFYRNSIGSRLRLFFCSSIRKERIEDDFFFRLKILLGGV